MEYMESMELGFAQKEFLSFTSLDLPVLHGG